MKALGIGGCKTIEQFVDMQITALKQREQTFESVYEVMFSHRENVMFETTDGNKIYKFTYGEIYENINKTAYSLIDKVQGIGNGTIVGIYMDNCIEWIEIFWAILKCGSVPLLMNKRLDIERLEKIIEGNNVAAVITDSREFSVSTVNYKELDKNAEKRALPAWENKIILMSSGSTNDVKLCVYNGHAICEQIYNAEKIVKQSKLIKTHYEGYLKQLTFLPFYHVFGLVACYMWFAFFARTFVLLKNMSGETILNTVRKHKVTHIFAVPMLWEKIRNSATKLLEQRRPHLVKKVQKGLKLSNSMQKAFPKAGRRFAKKAFKEIRDNLFGNSVQFLITGGGAVTTKTLEFFNGIGYHLANGYGMTEIGIASVELSESTKYLNSGSAGKPFGSISFRVNENGLLEVQSKSIANEIKVKDEIYTYTEKDFFPTGDGAKIKNKRLYILGRGDDLIVSSSGENVSPSAIEDGISIPDVSVCMLGVDKGGKIVSTLLVQINKYFSKKKVGAIKTQLFEIIKERGYGSLIEEIYFTNEPLMLESEFKLNRNSIRKRIASGDIQLIHLDSFENQQKEENINAELREQVRALFSEVLEKEISIEDCNKNFFFELGGTSLAYFQLIENIKADFQVPFPVVDEQSIATVDDFCLYLQDL